MKRLKLTKLIVGSLMIASVLTLAPIGANAEWKQDSTGWWYADASSYYTGWQMINGKWYYFYQDSDLKGYMAHNAIINKYYLNNDGICSNGGSEIQEYVNLLSDTNWQKENGITNISQNIIVDINQDGTKEMLLDNGENQGRLQVSIISYNNGNIKIQNIPSGQGGYYGYSSSEKVFFTIGGHMGHYYINGYKLENNQYTEVYSSTDEEVYSKDSNGNLIISGHNYTVNEQKVSKTEYDESLKKFGEIEK